MPFTDHTGTVASRSGPTSDPGPAPYGQVCVNCAKAKCKCLIRSGSNNCERCLRLGKECRSSEGTRRTSRTTSRLEEKVDDILSLVKSINEVTETVYGHSFASSDSNKTVSDQAQIRPLKRMIGQSKTASDRNKMVAPVSQSSKSCLGAASLGATQVTRSSNESPTLFGPARSASELPGPPYSLFEPSAEEAEGYLTYFRTHSLANFAFICLPASTTARSLRQERPFLFLAIMAVSSTSATQREGLGQEIKKMVARDILSENEGKIDVLLGLLVFLAWGHDQYASTPLMSRFMHLAISMVFDLRLNRPPLNHQFTIFDFDAQTQDVDKDHTERTMEERRAVLGCFLLSSVVSWYFAKIDSLRWTTHMDECLRVLSSEHASPTDEMFAHQVRLQRIAENVAQTSSNHTEFDQSKVHVTQLPFYLKAFQLQLADIKGSISPKAEHNQILLAYVHHTELFINALALSKDANMSGFERVDCLSRCLNSIKSWIEIFFNIPLSHYLGSSFPFATQLTHCIVILHRLSTFEDSTWDKAMVRSKVDILVVLERLISNFRQFAGQNIDNSEPIMFQKLALLFESMRSWSKSKLITNAGYVNDSFIVQIMDENIDTSLQDSAMNIADDAWLSEIFGPWSYENIYLGNK